MGEHTHIDRIVAFLDNPQRKKEFSPEELLELAAVEGEKKVLDLGSGTGYLTLPAARRTNGTVYAVDISYQMLGLLKEKAEKEHIENIQFVQGTMENIPVAGNTVDVAMASLVLHEGSDLMKTLKQLKRILKPGGVFLCLECEKTQEAEKKNLPRISSVEMEEALKNSGYTQIEKRFSGDLYVVTASV